MSASAAPGAAPEPPVTTCPSEPGTPAISYPAAELEIVDAIEPSADMPPVLRESGLTMVIVPEQAKGPDDQLRLIARLRIENEQTSGVHELTQPTEITYCANLMPGLDVIWSDEDLMVVDAQLVCSFGSIVRHQRVVHTVVVVTVSSLLDGFGEARILHGGLSEVTDDDGLALEASRLQYYVEANELAVYRQTVAWCNRVAMKEARGRADCRQEPRTLQEVARVRIR